MGDTKHWVVEGIFEGGLFIPEEGSNLPATNATVALTSYAVIEQYASPRAWASRIIYLGLEIPINADNVYFAWQEMEAFARALGIEKQVSITVQITRMTDESKEWPKGISFLRSRDFPQRPTNWEPADHHNDPKNRVRFPGGLTRAATTAGLGPKLEKSHEAFSHHDDYQSELVKDYLSGLDIESREPSLAMLYFYKILERIGKKEYDSPKSKTLRSDILETIIHELNSDLTADEKQNTKQYAKDINRWRHNKSEAHLITEGLPTKRELELCKKLAYLAILKRV